MNDLPTKGSAQGLSSLYGGGVLTESRDRKPAFITLFTVYECNHDATLPQTTSYKKMFLNEGRKCIKCFYFINI